MLHLCKGDHTIPIWLIRKLNFNQSQVSCSGSQDPWKGKWRLEHERSDSNICVLSYGFCDSIHHQRHRVRKKMKHHSWLFSIKVNIENEIHFRICQLHICFLYRICERHNHISINWDYWTHTTFQKIRAFLWVLTLKNAKCFVKVLLKYTVYSLF